MKRPPYQLTASFEEKIWGVTNLSPWFGATKGRVGEVSFHMPDGRVPPVLVKFLFTSERLSVQVHPGDDYARTHEGKAGKDEVWYVLAAEPGATLAAGFVEPLTREQAREAALSGRIEDLLAWWPVQAGQVYYVPAGTVHTLGAGIAVCEIQQPSPVTYRLYDYGRGRQLHLEQALDVARLERYPGPAAAPGREVASCAGFRVERLEVTRLVYVPEPDGFELLIPVEGGGTVAGQPMAAGQVWHVPAGGEEFAIVARERALLLRACLPKKPGNP